ncbi:MAG: HAD family phosphatase [Yoonia sp.]|nr:HAD family phosphatase [Yoonia sp.]
MTINAVIFDIGNVLIEWQPERFFDATVGEGRRCEMFAAIDLHGINDEVDRGANFRDTIYAAADANPEFRAEVRMWHDNWLELATPAIPQSVRILRSLRAKGVLVFALTNFGIQTFEIAEPVYPFLGEFDRRYISGHMGVIKPDAEIYQRLEDDCGIDPATLLFTDDRIDNIRAANARGWQTHLFEGPQGWADCVVSHGLLTKDEAA